MSTETELRHIQNPHVTKKTHLTKPAYNSFHNRGNHEFANHLSLGSKSHTSDKIDMQQNYRCCGDVGSVNVAATRANRPASRPVAYIALQ